MSDGPSNCEVDKPGVNRPALAAQCWCNRWLLSIILMDVEMQGMDGISTTEGMGSSILQSAVVMLSISNEVHTRVQAQEQQGSWRGMGRERCYERRSLKPRS